MPISSSEKNNTRVPNNEYINGENFLTLLDRYSMPLWRLRYNFFGSKVDLVVDEAVCFCLFVIEISLYS